MKKTLLTKLFFSAFTLLAITNIAQAQAPQWEWANIAYGNDNDYAKSIAVDNNSNVYMAGDYQSSSLTFGATVIANTSAGRDGFLSKYTASGELLWVKSYEAENNVDVYEVTTDNNNNVYMVGAFENGDFIVDNVTLTSNGQNDMFVLKYNSNGELLWARSAGSMLYEYAQTITVDAAGNVYVAGIFFSPSLSFADGITLTNATNGTGHDVFLVKYDNMGNALWARSGNGFDYEEPTKVLTDAAGNIILTGFFYSPQITFGNVTLTNNNVYGDIFLVKYDSNGNVLWGKREGGNNYERPRGLAIANDGSICMSGYFESSTLTLGSTTLINNGSYDIFVAKFDSNGNNVWAKAVGGIGLESANSLVLNSDNEIIISGLFGSTSITFPGTPTLISNGNFDLFVAKYDFNGNVLWAAKTGGSGYENATSSAISITGDLYFTGAVQSPSVAFGNTILNATTGRDVYVAKMPAQILNIEKFEYKTFVAYPNPAKEVLYIKEAANLPYTATDISGRIVLKGEIKNNAIAVSVLPTGLYFVNINNTTIKFIKE